MNKTRYLSRGMAFLLSGLSLIIAVALTAPKSARANPGVLYAAPTAQGSGNCSGWANACTLQYALSCAVSGDEIWVKKGVHYPGTTRGATFTLKNGVALYGGFAGTETSRTQRNWQTNVTVLSGDIDGNDITDPNGVVTTTANISGTNAYHVVTGGGTDNTAVLDGFIITAGQANDSQPYDRGGGMYNNSSSPTLTNVTFSGNTASFGGGMYNWNSSPMLNHVTFSGNSAASYGGGMYNEQSTPRLTNVTFSGNFADSGGGMYNQNRSNLTLKDVTFSGNSAASYGGGMDNVGYSSPTLTNVTFSGNSARYGGGMYNYYINTNPTLTNVTFSGNSASYGGGMDNYESSTMLKDVTFSGNSAVGDGGGMRNYNSSPTLTNVTFGGNTADHGGGGMYNQQSTPTLTNVTFSGNSASSGGGMLNYYSSSSKLVNVTFSGNTAQLGGGMYNSNSSSPALRNVIMWGDTATNGRELYNSSSTPSIAYSDIQGCGGSGGGWGSACGTDDGHNIDADPRFEDADGADNNPGTADDNLRLQLTSPAIDAGNNAVVPSGVTTDLDGNPRIVNGVVDMGAYEVQRKIFLPLIMRG